MIPWLSAELGFPPVASALAEPAGPNGLLAAGGDLSPPRLLAAYAQGVFPWYSPGEPILWWSPDPRMVLFPEEIKISRSLAKTLRNSAYSVHFDTAFSDTIRACAHKFRLGQSGTWISPEMITAYERLHHLGYAHSVETRVDGVLVGGLYGIALGRVFYGESMFSQVRDASKIALAHLCAYLKQQEFGIIDCQMETSHLTSLGARLITRSDFVATVGTLIASDPVPGPWPAMAIDGYFKGVR
ncbi:leucyl/phenylalanyl-tRNA--protein transferase [Rugosibacter aromaticivorans]|uniref:leucyl/phenylalanyl-tRNA--protein transferase n=1 Tax=Rugosibacter aromaticivorans TaxID=1565605 RepID=UPI000A53892A|nr:leucyl/phenylalanyl-tRNA--protein transferase [Rugosibacter aromaticivorans]TBR15848.1 MAG: leucyl/phenylalanyl-tRNA--protein transferase [Rugosibacter sp.]